MTAFGEVDQVVPALRAEPRCRVCTSPLRQEVEHGIALGLRDAEILLRLPNGTALSKRNLAEHRRRGHSVQPRSIEEQTLAELQSLTTTRQGIEVLLARTALRRAFERLLAGELEITMKDAIRVMRFLHQARTDDGTYDRQAALRAIERVTEIALNHLPEFAWAAFVTEAKLDPLIYRVTNAQRA